MVITEHFVYIHLPKTGGTFVETVLSELLDKRNELFIDTSRQDDKLSLRVSNQHSPVSDIPEIDRSKKILFTVRNPYDHYVSFYEFGWWKLYPGDLFNEVRIREKYPHFPNINFEEWLVSNFDWRLLDSTHSESKIAKQIQESNMGPLTLDYVRFIFPCPEIVAANMKDNFEVVQLRKELPDIYFLHMENLNSELFKFLLSIDYNEQNIKFILEKNKILPEGSHPRTLQSWIDYYTPELKELVRKKERLIFEMFPEYDF